MHRHRERYVASCDRTLTWILASIARGRGGSCAHFSPVLGWSRPYPETTGYLIPTLLEGDRALGRPKSAVIATDLGVWLESIQQADGSWLMGLHPPRAAAMSSVFNTGQIVLGMMALFRASSDTVWLESAKRAATWLAAGVDSDGRWAAGHYVSGVEPSYYTRVAWPMLDVAKEIGDSDIEKAALRVLNCIFERRCPDGSFTGWGFQDDGNAFTHTIAYTLRGFLESAVLLGTERFRDVTLEALERLRTLSELSNGRLAGAFSAGWKPNNDFVCVTGCAQLAICFMNVYEIDNDLRWVNAAGKLVDFVGSAQGRLPLKGLYGAVPGSVPFWGRYMRFRYPNWAAKFYVDALRRMIAWIDARA